MPLRTATLATAAVLVAAVTIAVLGWRGGGDHRENSAAPLVSATTPEAKSYLKQLELTDVDLSAADSLADQRLVELRGHIRNGGNRRLRSVEIFCLFRDAAGKEIHRERAALVGRTAAPLAPGETRPFRLAFDALPSTWNQAAPTMVIASIDFAS